jgi:hypothetical protein
LLRLRYPEAEFSWVEQCIEITPKGCSKSEGIAFYLDYNHLSRDNVLVIGDSGNDISMFEAFKEAKLLHAPFARVKFRSTLRMSSSASMTLKTISTHRRRIARSPNKKGRKHFQMNQISEVLTTLIHYKVVVRDTLEYTLPKDAYDVALFKEKKRSILVEVDQPTPLKSILDRSGDNGKNLEKTIRDFYDQVYGDSSTILEIGR